MKEGRSFVDTNIFVYAEDFQNPKKQKKAHSLLKALWENHSGRTSIQVLQEFYQVTTRKLRPGLPLAEARDIVERLQAWNPLPTTQDTLSRAWQVEDRYGLSFWDALIVASAIHQECAVLFTEDLQHGQVLDDRLTVVNPFLESF